MVQKRLARELPACGCSCTTCEPCEKGVSLSEVLTPGQFAAVLAFEVAELAKAEEPNLVWSERERLWREEEAQVIYSPSNPKPFTHPEVNKTRVDDWSGYQRAVSWRGYYG